MVSGGGTDLQGRSLSFLWQQSPVFMSSFATETWLCIEPDLALYRTRTLLPLHIVATAPFNERLPRTPRPPPQLPSAGRLSLLCLLLSTITP